MTITPETTCPYCRGTFRAVALHDALADVDRLTRERDAERKAHMDLMAERNQLHAERDAALVTLATLREAAEHAHDRSPCCDASWASGPDPDLGAALTASADPAATGARLLAEAEERGARWAYDVEFGISDSAERVVLAAKACHAARERGVR